MFGGYAPLPLRLTGSPTEGWSAAALLRMAADVAAASRTLPFARVYVTRGTGGASPVVVNVTCRAPNVSVTVTGDHPNNVVISFEAAPDDVSEVQHALSIRSARVSRYSSSNPAEVAVTGPTEITIDPNNSSALNFTVSVYGSWNPHSVEDYGAFSDKRDTDTETTPYAWKWYRELGSALGSAFGTSATGLLHCRKIAYARALASVERAEERVRNNSTPHTSTISLADWADALAVGYSSQEPNWLVRQRCAVFYGARGGDLAGVQASCAQLLGGRFVSVISIDEDDPANSWPVSWDMGGGVWCESRRRILVDVRVPGDANNLEFNNLVQLQLMKLLDRTVPATVWFDWTSTETAGFYLDISPLDFTGL